MVYPKSQQLFSKQTDINVNYVKKGSTNQIFSKL